MAQDDGIFTQPGPDGIFGRGGEPGDASAPAIDSDDVNLRETLVVAFPSPGHMRVARALRHAKTGQVKEYYEQYREPTPEEVEFLARQGLKVGPGSMVERSLGATDVTTGEPPPAPGIVAAIKRQPWMKIGMGVALGAAGYWAAQRWVIPMVTGVRRNPDDDEDEDEDEDENDEQDSEAESIPSTLRRKRRARRFIDEKAVSKAMRRMRRKRR